MFPILMAVGAAACVAFGYLLNHFLAKGDRDAALAQGRSDGDRIRLAAEERIAAKDARLEELLRERAGERETLEKLRSELAALRAQHFEVESRLTESRQAAEERINLLTSSQERVVETIRNALGAKIEEQERRIHLLTSEAQQARADAESMRSERALLNSARLEAEARVESVKTDAETRLATVRADADARVTAVLAESEQRATLLHEELERRAAESERRVQEARRTSTVAPGEDVEARLLAAMRSASDEAIRRNQDAFLSLAKTTLQGLQAPVRSEMAAAPARFDDTQIRAMQTSLDQIARAVASLESERSSTLSGLSNQVAALVAAQKSSAASAPSRTDLSSSGPWGELQLRRVIELAGLAENSDFDLSGEGGPVSIPLPNGKSITIDSGAPLNSYIQASETADQAQCERLLAEYSDGVRRHIEVLASSAGSPSGADSTDLLIAFLPADSYLSCALHRDPSLMEFGLQRRVLLTSPSSLLALLKAVGFGWRQYHVAKSAQEIAALGMAVHSQLSGLVASVDELRSHLSGTVDSYNRLSVSLDSGFVPALQRIQEIASPGQASPSSPNQVVVLPRQTALSSLEPLSGSMETLLPIGSASTALQDPDAAELEDLDASQYDPLEPSLEDWDGLEFEMEDEAAAAEYDAALVEASSDNADPAAPVSQADIVEEEITSEDDAEPAAADVADPAAVETDGMETAIADQWDEDYSSELSEDTAELEPAEAGLQQAQSQPEPEDFAPVNDLASEPEPVTPEELSPLETDANWADEPAEAVALDAAVEPEALIPELVNSAIDEIEETVDLEVEDLAEVEYLAEVEDLAEFEAAPDLPGDLNSEVPLEESEGPAEAFFAVPDSSGAAPEAAAPTSLKELSVLDQILHRGAFRADASSDASDVAEIPADSELSESFEHLESASPDASSADDEFDAAFASWVAEPEESEDVSSFNSEIEESASASAEDESLETAESDEPTASETEPAGLLAETVPAPEPVAPPPAAAAPQPARPPAQHPAVATHSLAIDSLAAATARPAAKPRAAVPFNFDQSPF